MTLTSFMKRACACVFAAAFTANSISCQAVRREPYRPQYHYTPSKNWMNDPNGLVYHKGQFDMFYQYNPTGDVWGNMSWGHAVSRDLMRWDELPVALNTFDAPAGPSVEFYYSGSAVTDYTGTTGWGNLKNPPLVAVYTSHCTEDIMLRSGKTVSAGQESQSIAYSTDDGKTWKEYEHNPVILEPPTKYADQYQNFRDPFVFWHATTRRWIMLVVLAQKHMVIIYTSPNLKDWTYASEFGPVNAVGGQWECPSLFQLSVDGNRGRSKWVLMLGLNPGGVALPQGSGTQYLVGTFDGTSFKADIDSIMPVREPSSNATIFEDWTTPSFEESSWTTTGDFAGKGPSDGQVLTLWDKGDGSSGTLRSKAFNISHDYVQFQIGCCSNSYVDEDSATAVNLIVDEKVVKSTTGVSGGAVAWRSWMVREFIGRTARIELIDTATGGYGHLNVGKIVFTDVDLPVEANWADWGPDYYAAVPWNGLPAGQTSPWRSSMSIPRSLELQTIKGRPQLVQQPHPLFGTLTTPGRPLFQRSWRQVASGNIAQHHRSALRPHVLEERAECYFSHPTQHSRKPIPRHNHIHGYRVSHWMLDPQ